MLHSVQYSSIAVWQYAILCTVQQYSSIALEYRVGWDLCPIAGDRRSLIGFPRLVERSQVLQYKRV